MVLYYILSFFLKINRLDDHSRKNNYVAANSAVKDRELHNSSFKSYNRTVKPVAEEHNGVSHESEVSVSKFSFQRFDSTDRDHYKLTTYLDLNLKNTVKFFLSHSLFQLFIVIVVRTLKPHDSIILCLQLMQSRISNLCIH